MERTFKRKLVVGTVAGLAVLGVGGAIAANRLDTPSERSKAILDDAAKQLGVSPTALDNALEKAFADQIRPYIPKGRTYKVLGTDGFGRSDFRSKLREHFEVNRHYIAVAALKALADEGTLPIAKVAEAIKKYGINADKINPLYA